MSEIDTLRAENLKLYRENESLRELVRYYETLPDVTDWRPAKIMGLTKSQAGVLRLLFQRVQVSREQLFHHCYHGDPDRMPAGSNLPSVYIKLIRNKTRRYGIEIETVWGQGYRLPTESRAAISAMEADDARAHGEGG